MQVIYTYLSVNVIAEECKQSADTLAPAGPQGWRGAERGGWRGGCCCHNKVGLGVSTVVGVVAVHDD